MYFVFARQRTHNAPVLAKCVWNESTIEAVTRSGWTSKGELNPMTKQDDYLDSAAETFDLATRTSNSADKSHLLNLAEKWLDLADRSHRQPKRAARPFGEHPLVKRAFRGTPADRE